MSSKSDPVIFSDILTKSIKDCDQIEKYESVALLTRDYVRLAFESNCWDEELRKNINSAIKDLNKSINKVKKVGGKIRILVVPAAWAFNGEGISGKTHEKYNMTINAIITSEPLVKFLKNNLTKRGVEVVSLEKVIKGFKKKTNKKFYFPKDGHWNKNAHKTLGAWMAETFYQ